MTSAKPGWAYAPASVGNFICGFDVLGVALEGPGDLVGVESTPDGHHRVQMEGLSGAPPLPESNTAFVAVLEVARLAGYQGGLSVQVFKGLPLSGGMGGSAASAVAGAVAANAYLDARLDRAALLECALKGEAVASGSIHGDNVAPSLYGGIVLCRTHPKVQAIPLPKPAGATLVVVHPELTMETRSARACLGSEVPLTSAVHQWSNTATLMVGLYEEDWDLIGTALYDEIAEPLRKGSIPGFDQVVAAARDAGASGASLSGAGPSVFAFCQSREVGDRCARVMIEAFRDAGVRASAYVSSIGAGARVVSVEELERSALLSGFDGYLR